MQNFKLQFSQWLLTKSPEWLMLFNSTMLFVFFASQTGFSYTYFDMRQFINSIPEMVSTYCINVNAILKGE